MSYATGHKAATLENHERRGKGYPNTRSVSLGLKAAAGFDLNGMTKYISFVSLP